MIDSPPMPLTGYDPHSRSRATNSSHYPSYAEHPATSPFVRQTTLVRALCAYIGYCFDQVHDPLSHFMNGVGLHLNNPLKGCNLVLEVGFPLCLMVNLFHVKPCHKQTSHWQHIFSKRCRMCARSWVSHLAENLMACSSWTFLTSTTAPSGKTRLGCVLRLTGIYVNWPRIIVNDQKSMTVPDLGKFRSKLYVPVTWLSRQQKFP